MVEILVKNKMFESEILCEPLEIDFTLLSRTENEV